MTNWRDLSARASLASHRLIGWIYWDPDAIARFTALGVPNGLGYYITTRSAPLASVGNNAVTAGSTQSAKNLSMFALMLLANTPHLKTHTECAMKPSLVDCASTHQK